MITGWHAIILIRLPFRFLGVRGSMESYDIVIIGGGIMGTSAAYFLTKEGVKVLLLERSSVGQEASGRNAGSMMLQVGEYHSVVLRKLALEIWAELSLELGERLEFAITGGLKLAETKEQLKELKEEAALHKEWGLFVELLTPEDLKEFAPYIGPTVMGAAYSPEEARSNPLTASLLLARAAQKKGARFQLHEEVLGIEEKRDGTFLITTQLATYRAHKLLNTAGVWSKKIFSMVGIDAPITISPQQVMVSERIAPLVPHLLSHIEGRLTLKQLHHGSILIGGGWPALGSMDKRQKRVKYESLPGNAQYACRAVNGLEGIRIIRIWAGLEGRSPDRLPLLGRLDTEKNFYYACCAKGGYTVGPALGRLITEYMLTGIQKKFIKGLSLQRF